MKKILITGASGFLGQHLQEKLSQTKDYRVISFSSENADLTRYEDVLFQIGFHNPHIVIHLAAVCGGIGANKKSPADFFEKNASMSVNILKACHEIKVEKLITLGSVCSYPKYAPVPFKEELIWDGYPEETNAPYGIAKRMLMEGCKAYHEQYGDNFIHLIPVNLAGEKDHFDLENSHVIPALIRKMYEAKENGDKKVEIWGDGSASREFLYVGDCAEAIVLAMEKYNSPDPVNIGNGKEVSIKNLVLEVKEVVGFKGEIVFDDSKPNGQPRRCLDVTKAKERFGFEAKTSLQETLKKTYDWYVKQTRSSK